MIDDLFNLLVVRGILHLPCANQLEQRLTPLLGPFTARMALKTFATSKLGRAPEQLSQKDVPALLDALRPMLNTLVGSARAGAVLDELRKELAAP